MAANFKICFIRLDQGRLGVPYIHLWLLELQNGTQMLYYHCIPLSTCNNGISTCAMCYI